PRPPSQAAPSPQQFSQSQRSVLRIASQVRGRLAAAWRQLWPARSIDEAVMV
ncbi:unnamed protein product, partial [Effrenium voratum]